MTAKEINDVVSALNENKNKLESKYSKKWDKKVAKEQKFINDNDRRVKQYGKKQVIRANRIQMIAKSYLGGVAAKATAEIGSYACRRALQKSGGVANAKTRATGAAALAALGLVVGVTAYDISRNIKDNRYAREYDTRHSK